MRTKRKITMMISAVLTAVLLCPLTVAAAEEDDVTNNGHTHTWEQRRVYDETYCWRPCSVEGCTAQDNKLEHSLSLVTDVEPTEEMDGEAHYKCHYGCGYESERFPIAYYAPTASAKLTEWTVNEDVVIDVDTKGGILDEKVMQVGFVGDVTEYWRGYLTLTPVIDLDSTGKGTVTYTGSEINKLIDMIQESGYALDQFTSLNIEVPFANISVEPARGDIVLVEIPINHSPAQPEETPTVSLEDESGVTMLIPENAPDNLELKVTVSGGSEEREAVAKVAEIEGDKIKTFDLSLLLDGQPYDYDGQFSSTVSLPVPEGWDMDKLVLYYFDEAAGTVTPVEFRADTEKSLIIFETNHFSRYVLAQEAEAAAVIPETPGSESGSEPDSGQAGKPETSTGSGSDGSAAVQTGSKVNKVSKAPKTGDETNVWLYLVLLTGAGAVTAGIYKRTGNR